VNRLRRSYEFNLVLKSRIIKSNNWLLAHTKSNQLGYARLGMIVGKKILSRAVDRNRIKRLIREVFRCEFQNSYSLDIVVILKCNPFIDKSEVPSSVVKRLFKEIRLHK
jgi:ribonuclease P protein component